MVFVVLKNGKVIQYNSGGAVSEINSSYVVHTSDQKFLVARIPVANVERIEFQRPCAIYKTKKVNSKNRLDY